MKVSVAVDVNYCYEIDVSDNITEPDKIWEYCAERDPVDTDLSLVLNGRVGYSSYTESITNSNTGEILWEY